MGFLQSGSKYGAKKTTIDGIKFDSKSEAGFFLQIRRLSKFEIIELQPKVYLTEARILYKPDFLLLDKETNEKFYVDVKGMRTPVFAIKARLWRYYATLPLRLYAQTKIGYLLADLVLPDKSNKKIIFQKHMI
jgi:hypothetical protein